MKIHSNSARAVTLATLPLAALSANAAVTHAASARATTQKFAGSTAEMRWGTVKVTIYVKSKKITNVKAAYSVHTSRSEFITGDAIPSLRQEVLQIQNSNIDTISGATDTSFAFQESLQSAITKAQNHKALKATTS